MSLAHLEGRSYGPFGVSSSRERVAAYVLATGDLTSRWTEHAPPGYAAVALFAVAPSLLWSEEVGDHSRILMHSDQTFRWHQPLKIDDRLAASGTVDKVRERGGLSFVKFRAEVLDGHGNVAIESESTFIMSAEEPPADSPEQPEPPVNLQGDTEHPQPATLPGHGLDLAPLQKSASRAALVKYAAASSDFNPLHWDHATARAAGLPRVVCHGLLLTAWMIQASTRHCEAPVPVDAATFRYKRPLLAGEQATVTGSVVELEPDHAVIDATLSGPHEPCVTARLTVDR